MEQSTEGTTKTDQHTYAELLFLQKRMIQWHETRTSPDIMEKVIKALNESTHPCPVGIDSNERVDLSRISDLVPRGDIIFKMIASHQ